MHGNAGTGKTKLIRILPKKPLALKYVQENLKGDEEVVNAAFQEDEAAK